MKFYKASWLKFEKKELSYDLIKSIYVEDESKLESEEFLFNQSVKHIFDLLENERLKGNELNPDLIDKVIKSIIEEDEKKIEELNEKIGKLETELNAAKTFSLDSKGIYVY